ncbi:MAG TPA: sulfite oxidase, partial [Rubrobacteraceae bacterium]|nr:sulfite oxidase [Rubrobacteraceae bacterium]
LALNAEMRWESLADEGYLTPNEHFFVRSHAPTPLIEASGWTLRIEGPGVERPLGLGYEELQSLPAVTATQALECAGNGRVFFEEVHGRKAEGSPWRLGAVGVAEWTGVPLREVLERAGLKGTAHEVMVESLDAVRMRRPLPAEKALEHDTLLAFGMNGEPLPSDHGFPVRLIVPGWAAVASVKWVGSVHVSEHAPLLSPWNTQKYVLTGGSLGSRREPVTTRGVKSAVELPWPARLEAGHHTVTGRAWSGHGSISRVDYSVDGGASWHGARLFGPNVPGAWARWDFEWKAAPGKYEIRVKATDDKGETQPDDVPWNDLGYLYGGVVGHPVEVYYRIP